MRYARLQHQLEKNTATLRSSTIPNHMPRCRMFKLGLNVCEIKLYFDV